MENMEQVVNQEAVEVKEEVKKEKQMTLREFYEVVASKEEITDEMVAIALKKIEQLDKKNEYARNHKKSGNSKKAKENAEAQAQILEVMEAGKEYKAKDLAEATGMSQQKVSAMAKKLVEAGKLTVDEVKVKGARLVKVYKVAE